MVNWTNKNNLPEVVVRAILNDDYSSGGARRSVTGLIGPPRMHVLKRQRHDEIEQDISESVWLLLGKAVHKIMEMGATDEVVEERLFARVNGWLISGAIDVQRSDGGTAVLDYKCTSVWTYVRNPEGKHEWIAQQNMYAWLIRQSKQEEVSKLQICCIFRDWRAKDIKPGYPPAPILMVDLPVWSDQEQEAYVLERVRAHQMAEMAATLGEELPLCSPEERWQDQKFHGLKSGSKRGRSFAIEAEATEYAGPEGTVEPRLGEPRRCDSYCSARPWCSQRQGEVNG